ncbi:hypothetical protein OOT46_09980 [Aquabacterium sp. A7-Y]|uniref:hypothetical protein n=1 Tax=Aquabacterium sp. A7-Y TaxID=1349605 RepID=UPI00223D7E08|nr:hypothetical protein [Aquabacterium sp. A7-Y]MCW7538175.1 hypothetical protein [Aquabacterium sp. A7-Y]
MNPSTLLRLLSWACIAALAAWTWYAEVYLFKGGGRTMASIASGLGAAILWIGGLAALLLLAAVLNLLAFRLAPAPRRRARTVEAVLFGIAGLGPPVFAAAVVLLERLGA